MRPLESPRLSWHACTTAEPSVRPARPADLERVVAVHTAAFPKFFLTSLGPAFLRRYYRTVLEFDGGCLMVAELEGRVAGFVAGFAEPRRFYGVFRSRPLSFAAAVAVGLLRRPWLFGHILGRTRSVFHRSQGRHPQKAPVAECELSSLAVDPFARRRGIGQQLVAAFVAAARERGLDVVRLKTDARDNDPANAFYAGLGFRISASVVAAGRRPMNEYELSLRPGSLRHAG